MSYALSTTAVVAGGIVSTLLILWPLAVWYEVRKCEKPKYKLLQKLGNKSRALYDRDPALEIRQYDPFVVAEVTVDSQEMRDALSTGFRAVAGFIFGDNKARSGESEQVKMMSPVQVQSNKEASKKIRGGSGEKVSMTSPVLTDMADGGKYTVSFVMPSKYKRVEDLPKPNNAAVVLKEVPAHTLAAISWRGLPRPTEETVKQKRIELEEELQTQGIKVMPGADTKLYQYYPPFAPFWLRLQDVLLPVEPSSLPVDNPEKAKST